MITWFLSDMAQEELWQQGNRCHCSTKGTLAEGSVRASKDRAFNLGLRGKVLFQTVRGGAFQAARMTQGGVMTESSPGAL